MTWFSKFEFPLADLLDVLLVAFVFYWILRLIRGTRALYMLAGLTILMVIYWVSTVLELFTLNWIFSNFLSGLLLVIVVVFQHDIRRALTQVGRTRILSSLSAGHELRIIEELIKTCVSLANKKIGALVVIERDASVRDYVDIGIEMDAIMSKELVTSIFLPTAPIHDGAILIQKGRVTAAGCFLPLTMNPDVESQLGTRHRAALGLTEETDAIVIVISEEKGWISLVAGGHITRGLDGAALRKLLMEHFKSHKDTSKTLLGKITGVGSET